MLPTTRLPNPHVLPKARQPTPPNNLGAPQGVATPPLPAAFRHLQTLPSWGNQKDGNRLGRDHGIVFPAS